MENMLSSCKTRKLSGKHSNKMEGHLTVHELGQALKLTKNNKTPGIDGFPADFLKVFLERITCLDTKGIKKQL